MAFIVKDTPERPASRAANPEETGGDARVGFNAMLLHHRLKPGRVGRGLRLCLHRSR